MATRDKQKTGTNDRMLVRDVMTPQPAHLPSSATVSQAAKAMREREVGAILVTDENGLCGMVTDRDIVVRAVADGKDPNRLKLGDLCSRDLFSLEPTDPLADAVQLMRHRSVRRIPVIEGRAKPVGIVSLGDLAQRLDPTSVLGDISAAQPTH